MAGADPTELALLSLEMPGIIEMQAMSNTARNLRALGFVVRSRTVLVRPVVQTWHHSSLRPRSSCSKEFISEQHGPSSHQHSVAASVVGDETALAKAATLQYLLQIEKSERA
jgi:hypothetical protein